MAFELGEAYLRLRADGSSLAAGLDRAKAQVVGFGSAIGKLGAWAAGTFFAGFALSGPLKAFAESEESTVRLQDALDKVGPSGGTLEGLQSMAKELQRVTGYSDEAIMNVQSLLLLKGKATGDELEKLVKLTLDFAQYMKTDAVGSANLLARAFANPERGISMLARQFGLAKEQMDALRATLKAGGDVRGTLLTILDKQVGGFSAKMGKTLSGTLMILKESIGDLAEVIGEALAPFARGFAKIAQAVVDAWDRIGPEVQNIVKAVISIGAAAVSIGVAVKVISLLGAAFVALRPILAGALASVSPLVLALAALGGVIFALLPGDTIGEKFKGIGETFRDLFKPLTDSLAQFAPQFDALMNFMKRRVEDMKFVWENWGAIAEAVRMRIGQYLINIGETFKWLFDNIKNYLSWFGENWFAVFRDAFNAVLTLLHNLGKNIGDFFGTIWGNMMGGNWEDMLEGFQWTPLLDGFEKTMKELPKLTKLTLTDVTDEIDEMLRKKFEAKGKPAPGRIDVEPDKPVEQGSRRGAKVEFVGLVEMAKRIQGTLKTGDDAKDIAKRQLGVQEQIRDGINDVKDAIDGLEDIGVVGN